MCDLKKELEVNVVKTYQDVAYNTKTLADLLIAARASLEMFIPSGN